MTEVAISMFIKHKLLFITIIFCNTFAVFYFSSILFSSSKPDLILAVSTSCFAAFISYLYAANKSTSKNHSKK
ncbi:hypothetical protein D5018_20585 [Parashewanella curva]|uniref:Uncharacterized protein n=1 Tax=Parashewanella curva TaxID=2338552 RepID=A0A3L8PR24_9GAMM|nr:hypothetical protein D5018_20585 [Parashewanella curva]